jgi:RimJ/RimL family protein N-acetyltransferase
MFDQLKRLDAIDGDFVRLEPLSMSHHHGFCEVGLDEDLWRLTVGTVRNPDEMQRYIDEALMQRAAGSALPFAIIDKLSGRIAGSTRFGNIDSLNRRVEIGWTWVGKEWQRTAVNSETKYQLLRYAFETLECVRVEFKTDSLNLRSRTALLRIGATEEGILRRHMLTHDGRFRDTVYFSILESEWADVKVKLLERMGQSQSRSQQG